MKLLNVLAPAVFALFAVLAGCRFCPPPAPTFEPTHTLVFLKTGQPNTRHAPNETAEIFQGHFANMERLAKERHLLVAGPFGQQRHDEALRGLFVLATAEHAQAKEWAGSDPAVRAGVFVLEYHELVTAAPLAEALEHELARLAELEARGETPSPGDGARGYVLLTANDHDAAARELRELQSRAGGVLLFARLDGTRAFALLDAADLDAARTRFAPQLERIGIHVLDEWFASGELANLVH